MLVCVLVCVICDSSYRTRQEKCSGEDAAKVSASDMADVRTPRSFSSKIEHR